MKLTTNSKAMLASVMAASRVINSKNVMPICECVKVWQSEGGEWWLTGGDAEKQVTVSAPVTEAEGETMAVCVNAVTLAKTFGAMPDAPVTMDVKDGMVTVKCGKGKYKIPYQAADEYPTVMAVTGEGLTEVVVPGSVFVTCVKAGMSARTNDELRPTLSGVAMDCKADGVTFVASDGKRMFTYETKCAVNGTERVVLLPSTVAKSMDMFKACGEVHVVSNGSRLMIYSEGVSMIAAGIEGKYPNYKSVIPDLGKSKTVVCNVKEMISALQRCAVFASDASQLVAMTVGADALELKAEDIDFSTSGVDEVGVVRCDCEAGFRIGAHIGHLVELLKNVKTENVVIKVSDAGRPIVILDEGDSSMLEILMPMVLNY